MKNEKLFEAIGYLDEAFLADSREAPAKKSRRILWKAALVAAIIGCLAITVAASGGNLWGRTEQYHGKLHGSINGQIVELPSPDHILNVQIEMSLEEDAPSCIETIYTPENVKDSEWLCAFIDLNNCRANSQWQPEGWKEYITLTQTAGGIISSGIFRTMTSAVPTDDYYTTTITREDREYFYISSDLYETDGNYAAGYSQMLYWTDNVYVFALEYPYWMEMDQAWEIIDTLTPVDDVDGYVESIAAYTENSRKNKWSEFAAQYASDEPYEFRADVEKGWLVETETGSLKIYAEFSTNEDKPRIIERVIAPQLDGVQMYLSSKSESKDGVVRCGVMWIVPEYGDGQTVSLTQSCIDSEYLSEHLELISSASRVDAVKTEMLTWGDDTFFQVSYPKTDTGGVGERMLFWSDGDYAFCLTCPYTMPDVKVLEIINSIDGA